MEVIKSLLSKLRHTGVLFLIGVILIVYLAFGFVYWQQGGKQREYEEQIAKFDAILARPLPSIEKLQAEYEEINRALAPMTDVAAIERLVGIADESGIDVDPARGNFNVPTVSVSRVNMGGTSYQILSFTGIKVQGNRDNVMAFISDLDSGKTLQTMVLKKVNTSEVEIVFSGEEGDRRAEFRQVASAVKAMMNDAGLTRIPRPMNFATGVATNLMGDNPETPEIVEGFPDITTSAVTRGYSGSGTPRDGYVLYGHDRIPSDNTTQFESVNYIATRTTRYYYTSETDGTVRQFDRANVATAREYRETLASGIALRVTVDVDIYTKPEE
ncbi:MAG: hypothetical protein HY325_04910 [Chloroflexi bacterium]|nr:hypothetical protein [Chloroflexota bacterium]